MPALRVDFLNFSDDNSRPIGSQEIFALIKIVLFIESGVTKN